MIRHMTAPLGTAMDEGIKSLPEVIRAAAASPLGIFALMIICVSALAFTFFRKANEYIKLGIFFCLFIGIVAFWLSLNEAKIQNIPSLSPTPPLVTETSPSPIPVPSEWTSKSRPATPTSSQITHTTVSYVLTTATDPVCPGKVAEFIVTVTNLKTSTEFAQLTFHVPKFTTYGGYSEGAAESVVLGNVAAGATMSYNLDLTILGGNQSPPDGTIVTLVLSDLNRATSVSRSITVKAAPVAALSLSTEQGTVAPGEEFSYSLTYHNPASGALKDAQLSLQIPESVSLISTDGGGALGSDGVVRWPLKTLAPLALGRVHLHLKASTSTGGQSALLFQGALRDGGGNLLAQASDFKAVYNTPIFSYVLTAITDPVEPGKVAQFTITVNNLTDSTAFSVFTFRVPKFTTYGGYKEGTACQTVLGNVAAGASRSQYVDLVVLGGNQSPPDRSSTPQKCKYLVNGYL